MTVSGVVPQIRTTNLDESIDFYVSKLGFELGFNYDDFYAGIKAGNQYLHLKLVDTQDPSIGFVADGDHLHLYFTTDDAEAEAQKLKSRGVVFRKELAATPWGMKEFSVVDNQGHVLCFGQVSEAARDESPGRAVTTYAGACHCGAVEFRIDTSRSFGAYFRCNCSLCARKGAVIGEAERSAFRVVKGADNLSLYQWNTREAEHYFCKTCGIYTHHVMRGRTDTIGVNMACVDGVDVFALAPVEVDNGAGWSSVAR